MLYYPHPESFIFPPRCVFSKLCGPLASLASLPFYLWPARFARKYLTLDQFTSRDVGSIFLWGGGGGGCLLAKRADASNPSAQQAKRASCGRGLRAQPPAGSRGGAPWRGLGGRSPPEIFCEIGCFIRHLALKKFVGQQ